MEWRHCAARRPGLIVQPLCNGRLVAKQDYQVSDQHFKVSGNLIGDDDAKVRLLMAKQ